MTSSFLGAISRLTIDTGGVDLGGPDPADERGRPRPGRPRRGDHRPGAGARRLRLTPGAPPATVLSETDGMQQLSSLDAQFLHVESRHDGRPCRQPAAARPGVGAGGELTLDRLREVLEPRLHLAAPLRQRLVTVPLSLGLPYWVDDPHFDIEFHLREIGLPEPGDDAQLGEQVARIHARPLDRTRPLWEMYLIHQRRGRTPGDLHQGPPRGDRRRLRCRDPGDDHGRHGRAAGRGASRRSSGSPARCRAPLRPARARAWLHRLRQPLEVARTLPTALPHLADLPGRLLRSRASKLISHLADAALRSATAGSAAAASRSGDASSRHRRRSTRRSPHTDGSRSARCRSTRSRPSRTRSG